jgi:hypothetical protein
MEFKIRYLTLIAVAVVAGCKSTSPSQYISPRVEGRVLDVQTHQPIEAVKVQRLTADESYRVEDAPKGGQLMERAPSVAAGKDGRFILESDRAFALLRRLGWYAVSISFEHPAHQRSKRFA